MPTTDLRALTVRPILMSGPMVRAILAGTKTQTRRALRMPGYVIDERDDGKAWPWCQSWAHGDPDGSEWGACPYGAPGDRLWVREAWRSERGFNGVPADGFRNAIAARIHYESDGIAEPWAGKLRPSMFMVREFSRLTLEITSVRVERAQAISDADILAEGVTAEAVRALHEGATVKRRKEAGMHPRMAIVANVTRVNEPQWHNPERCNPIGLWRIAWTLINGRPSWDSDPFVWRLSFKVVDAAKVRASAGAP